MSEFYNRTWDNPPNDKWMIPILHQLIEQNASTGATGTTGPTGPYGGPPGPTGCAT